MDTTRRQAEERMTDGFPAARSAGGAGFVVPGWQGKGRLPGPARAGPVLLGPARTADYQGRRRLGRHRRRQWPDAELPARPGPPAAAVARPGVPAAVPHRRQGRRHRRGRAEGARPGRDLAVEVGDELPGVRRPGRAPVLSLQGGVGSGRGSRPAAAGGSAPARSVFAGASVARYIVLYAASRTTSLISTAPSSLSI